MDKKKLKGPIELIKESFRIYFKKENFIYLIKIALADLVVMFFLFVPGVLVTGLMGGVTKFSLPFLIGNPYTIGALAILLSLWAVTLGLWIQVISIKAVSQVVKGEIIGIKETFKLTWPRVWKYFLVSLLTGLVVGLGIILFIIPGIIFAIWFAFSNFIVVMESKGALDSLRTSKELVKGYFWPVLGRILVFLLLDIAIQLVGASIRVVGPIALVLFSPYFTLLPYLLYEDLKRARLAGEAG